MKARSPIEIMIDRACGVPEGAPAQAPAQKREVTAEETKAILAVIDASIGWWKSHRPVGWRFDKHARSATVNCPSQPEKMLAVAVAEWLRVSGER